MRRRPCGDVLSVRIDRMTNQTPPRTRSSFVDKELDQAEARKETNLFFVCAKTQYLVLDKLLFKRVDFIVGFTGEVRLLVLDLDKSLN